MEGVKKLSVKEWDTVRSQLVSVYKERQAKDPGRLLKLCRYKKENVHQFMMILEIKDEKFCLFNIRSKTDAQMLYDHCCNIIPHFWDAKPCYSEVFTDKVLTKLVKLMKLYGNSWSVAHMCVSLPLPEDTMMILLASDSFKDHFTSTHHPKGYTLLHLAIEMNSVSACQAVMRCADECGLDPGFHVKDQDSLILIQRANQSDSQKCLTFLMQSQSPCQSLYSSEKKLLSQFQRAIENKNSDMVKRLLVSDQRLVCEPYADGSICLHKACDHMARVECRTTFLMQHYCIHT